MLDTSYVCLNICISELFEFCVNVERDTVTTEIRSLSEAFEKQSIEHGKHYC